MPSDQRAAQFAAAVFATEIQHGYEQSKRLHCDYLPPLPQDWKEMMGHSFKNRFLEAANKKYNDLEQHGTFEHVSRTTATSKILPLKWVFDYKFDENSYLTKFKA